MVPPAKLEFQHDGDEAVHAGSIVKHDKSTVLTGSQPEPAKSKVRILDIRTSSVEICLNGEIIEGLQKPAGEKTLPTMLLYDQQGLKEFERITYCEEYYLTNAEIEVLEANAGQIAKRVPDGAVLVELGSGNLRKVNILLQALESAKKRVDYFALDLSLPELQRTFSQLPNGGFQYVSCYGLHGTYDDGRKWLQTNNDVKDRPRFVLWLGSSIGNFERKDAADFLATWRREVIRPGSQDRMLIGIDSCKDPLKVWHAYNDGEGITTDFILNGLKNANSILRQEVFKTADWKYFGEYDIVHGRHQASYLANRDLVLEKIGSGISILKGEKVRVERSYKYSAKETTALLEGAGLLEGARWGLLSGDYNLHLLYNPVSMISLRPDEYAPEPCPSLGEWKELWAVWDLVTLKMIRKDQYGSQPISLRNPCVFYLGHIPTFLDVHLTRATKAPATEPAHYSDIFQRGIDPDVDDPTQCHSHSQIPTTWPEVSDIIDFQKRVRTRVSKIYESGELGSSLDIRRALWLGYEHEMMHLETLLYMLLQHDLTIPPNGVPIPDFQSEFALEAAGNPEKADCWLEINGQDVAFGRENTEDSGGYFGWDNEYPEVVSSVKPFKAFSRPITNGEFAKYLAATESNDIPASWTIAEENHDSLKKGGKLHEETQIFDKRFVKTVFGPVPLELAQNWPVMASFDELKGCAFWMGGRLPTRQELHVIYDHVTLVKKGVESKKLSAMIDAVNGHLSMDGVHISPPPDDFPRPEMQADTNYFSDLSGSNVSFRRWNPTSVVGKICGRGDAGLWEWTDTVLDRWDGFKPMALYPEYTSDFFDTKHNFVLGGSWATHSRLAGRKTFVNWYQRNYRYTWCTARLVRDDD